MKQTIQKITEELIDRLPENDQYYRVDELRSWDFPSFIVRRIRVELQRNLADSMIIPKTDWANTNADTVLDAWQQFINAIKNEARLPASYAQAVIETAVSDVVEMLVQPRKQVPEVIFGMDDELTTEQIHERLEAVVVYRHFAVAISRYLQKKDLETLSKERCSIIITKVDEKLTSGYSPLNWAQMLEPLFQLLDDGIDTNLLRLFFEDKNMPRIARKFDLMDKVLSRAEFIEVLSSPDLLDFEGYEDDQSSLFEDQPVADTLDNPADAERKNEDGEEKSILPQEENHEIEKDTSFSSSEQQAESNSNLEEDTEEDDSLNAVFKDEEEKEQDEDLPKKQKDDVVSDNGNDEKNEPENKEQEESPQETEKEQEISSSEEKETDENLKQSSENGSEQETPMWMRYMSDEEIEEYKREHDIEEGESIDEDGFIDDPIIDLTEEDASEKEIKKLLDILSDDRELFVEKIFRGSDRAFDQAIEDIAAYDSWRDVSKFIEKDIFKRNLVDMYSEAAVDFTDRLQSYFLEKQNRNKQEN